ncbi:MAG: membrane-bound lytic murein transglycosylase MltF [Desulfobacterales bacterium]|nr:membrane-bound lytic murein transglycosylase MltF [Desulfobacterales bacterium]MDD4070914.1 membrane-bound lytic murein transglycosylase MltF [Desulfobacterales bacterium]MDD4393236.1 membrane-bound lytic murein transglycosylase MltF [Desulfobacterales bacterium]
MNIASKIILFFISISAVLILVASLQMMQINKQTIDDQASLVSILGKKELTVITRNNANCYYQYRGQEMGFEYDLARAFADYLGVRLNISVAENWEKMIPDLLDGKGDLIAASMTISPGRLRQVAFSDGYMPIQQQIIVHRNQTDIDSPEQLNGKTVHIRKGTAYQNKLTELKKQGIDLTIALYDDLSPEEFIRQVADREIEVTVANSNIALLNQRYYPQAVVAGPLNGEEYLGWAVHPEAKGLLEKINSFFQTIRDDGTFSKIYNRYYANLDDFDYVDVQIYHNRLKSRLPTYQNIIQKAAGMQNFDWRLIAAQIYQESHLDPLAKSHAGAYGLMQLTQSTADSYHVTDIYDPVQNIHAGVTHLKKLYDYFDQSERRDRLMIAFAAYNVGLGHIQDAQSLAQEIGLDPDSWSSLKQVLPLLRHRKYYKQTRYGYCRGTEPIMYVDRIMLYYDILKHQGIEYEINCPVKTKTVRDQSAGVVS